MNADKLGQVVIIRKESVEAAKEVPDNILDGIFVDSIHDFPNGINDFYAWLPKLKPPAVIAGHDYMVRFTGLIRAVDLVFGNDFYLPSNPEEDYYSTTWYVIIKDEVQKQRYIDRIKSCFNDPTVLLHSKNKYMHHEKGFMEKYAAYFK
jgi:hypothetical protein